MPSPENPRFDAQPLNTEPHHPVPLAADPFPPPAFLPSPPATKAGENPVWSGWDVLLIVGLALVTIFVSQLVILLGAHRFLYPQVDLSDLAQQPILLLISQFLIDAAVAVYMFILVEGKYRTRFWQAIGWNWPQSEWKLLGLGVLLLIGLSLLESVLPMPKDTPFEKLFARPRDAYLLSIIAVSLAPLVEELFFRGFLYPVIARRWGVVSGIILTALPFALMHLPQYGYAWGAMLVIFIVGVVCAVVRASTRSVAASFLVHVGYNGTQMLIAVVATHGFRHMPKAIVHVLR